MRHAKNVLLECGLISAIGLVIGLTANAMYSDGVELGRDYFHRNSNGPTERPPVQEKRPTSSSGDDEGTGDDEADALAHVVSYLQEQGLQVIRHDEVVAVFEDPLYQEECYVIIDARDDVNYRMGHIPGAYQWDHYRFKKYIDEVLPVCRAAEKIVTYCNGGDCEDSEFATVDLMDQGIDPGKLFVYPGGMDMWKEKGLPVEQGERGSCDIVNGRAVSGGGHD